MNGRKWLGALALLSTLICSTSYGSGPFAESRALGILMTRPQSSVMINGTPAISGTTLYRGDVVQTRKASTALVKLQSGATLGVAENSEVALDLAEPTAVGDQINLHRGAINLHAPSQQPEWVTVTGASVRVQGEGAFPAICRVALVGQSSAIMNDRGKVEIHGSGAPLVLPIGKYVTLEAGRPQGGSNQAGSVSAEIPKETVQRSGQTAKGPLNMNDAVYWNDIVRTLDTGRVRISLSDGSMLNVGARSEMRIVKHDANTQQTSIELTAGKMRNQVQKLTKQGGSFDVTTSTAVIGVVGTDFIVETNNDPDKHKRKTTVWCIDGQVKVRNLELAVAGAVLLSAGEYTAIAFGMPPTPAAPAAPGDIQMQISQTNPNAPTLTGGGGGMGNVANFATLGAAGAGAAVAGVAIGRANDASNFLTQAGDILNNTSDTLNGAANDANNAVDAANGASGTMGGTSGILTGILQGSASPTYPCGCH